MQLADVGAKQTNLRLQGNDYWSSGASFSIKVFTKTYKSFSTYVSGTGNEKNGAATVGRNVDPLLVNPAGDPTVGVDNIDALELRLDGYKLASASTLRDAGLNLFSQFGIDPGPRDFYGDALTGATTDIGADEYT